MNPLNIFKAYTFYKLYKIVKPRINGLITLAILIILILYIHSEYLNFVKFSSSSSGNYVGFSFIIKNLLIALIILGYFYFSIILQKTKDDSKDIKFQNKEKSSEKVATLDEFLEDDELRKK